jgi:hypothetical protein
MEGGAVTTNDDELAEAMRLMRNFGFKGYDNVIHPGTNGKMIEDVRGDGAGEPGWVSMPWWKPIAATMPRTSKHWLAFRASPCSTTIQAERNSHHYIVLEVGEECVAQIEMTIIAALACRERACTQVFLAGVPRHEAVSGDISARAPDVAEHDCGRREGCLSCRMGRFRLGHY